MPKVASPAARIAAALYLRKMKQTELCEKTGISKSRMSQYIHGKFEPKQDGIRAMAEALCVNEAWLMGYDDVPMEGTAVEEPVYAVHTAGERYRTEATPEEEDFSVFLRAFAAEAEALSPENREKLLELARFYKTQEGR